MTDDDDTCDSIAAVGCCVCLVEIKRRQEFFVEKMLLGARIQTADISTWVDLSVLTYP